MDRTAYDGSAGPLLARDPRRLGAYELTGRLGRGGQGAVFLGRSPDGAPVAVKLLHPDLAHDARARTRFVREVSAAKRVARFCTAQVLDADVDGDRPYIVSEYVPGASLYDLVADHGTLSGASLERLAIGTATALAAIHQAGVVHRDLKPQNVLIGPDGPRVIDFGIARAVDATATVSSRVVGTPSYMAPEQVRGATAGPAADVFAWAGTMVFAATGAPPFGNESISVVTHRILTERPRIGELPGRLRELVAGCLEKDPALRPDAPTVLLRLLTGGRGTERRARGTRVPDAASGPATALGVGAGATPTTPSAVAGPFGAGPTVPAAVLEQGATVAAERIPPPAPGGRDGQGRRRARRAAAVVVAAVAGAVVVAGGLVWASGAGVKHRTGQSTDYSRPNPLTGGSGTAGPAVVHTRRPSSTPPHYTPPHHTPSPTHGTTTPTWSRTPTPTPTPTPTLTPTPTSSASTPTGHPTGGGTQPGGSGSGPGSGGIGPGGGTQGGTGGGTATRSAAPAVRQTA